MYKSKTVVLTAYAVNPYKGSEDGTGWNISLELAKTHKVHIITRKNNRSEIERFLSENEEEVHSNMTFHYFDLPTWIMQIKHKLGERGYVLYFYFWQLFIPFFIKRKKINFDIAHAVNFHSDSHPQFLWTLGKPVFWGPIGHHPPVPKAYLQPIYGRKNLIKDRIYNAIKFVMRKGDPFYYISKWTAKRIFVINSQVNKAIKAKKSKLIMLPAVAQENKLEYVNKTSKKFTVLAVGRFVYMKGFDITINAFAQFYHQKSLADKRNIKLQLVGKGEELIKLKELIAKNDIEEATEIISWVEKHEMPKIYKQANAFCFGSHEGAGMVVPEALSYGLPVICFDNAGPGELCDTTCAIKIAYSNYQNSVNEFSQALSRLFYEPKTCELLGKNAVYYAKEKFTWKYKAESINNAYSLID